IGLEIKMTKIFAGLILVYCAVRLVILLDRMSGNRLRLLKRFVKGK
ncbi:hypothetical protein LCGC14_2984950, partial [marine sediment metagenome]